MVGKRALICAGVLLVVACGRGAHAQPPTAGSWGDLLDKARESAGASRASGAREGSLTRSSGRSGEIVGALQRQLVEQLVGKGEIRCVKRNGERQTVYEHMLQAGRKVDLDAPACEVAERVPWPERLQRLGPSKSGICDADDIDYRGSVSTTGGNAVRIQRRDPPRQADGTEHTVPEIRRLGCRRRVFRQPLHRSVHDRRRADAGATDSPRWQARSGPRPDRSIANRKSVPTTRGANVISRGPTTPFEDGCWNWFPARCR